MVLPESKITGIVGDKDIELIKCPDCDEELQIPKDAMVGEIISCSMCGTDWELGEWKNELKAVEKIGEDFGQ